MEMLELLASKVDAVLIRLKKLEEENRRLAEELAAERALREAARQQVENILNKLRDIASE
jgi:thiamine monophosphate synthase